MGRGLAPAHATPSFLDTFSTEAMKPPPNAIALGTTQSNRSRHARSISSESPGRELGAEVDVA